MERFWRKVSKSTDGCWEWIGGTARGYGTILFEGRMQMAHHVAWKLANREIPTGQIICHSCDNPRCVRLDHLFLGTHSENAIDRERKGRKRRFGFNEVPRIRDEVRQAIAQDLGAGALVRPTARKYGVSPASVRNIRSKMLAAM